MKQWRLLLAIIVAVLLPSATLAQDGDEDMEDDVRNHPVTVFLEQESAITAGSALVFVDGLTGEEIRIPVTGERFTLLERSVMYFDPVTRRVMLARPDGTIQEHPFVQVPAGARRVDWVVSDDLTTIAWTITGTDAEGRLTTRTSIADIDGENARSVLTDVDFVNNRLRALPLLFSQDKSQLFMDNHPDGISAFTAFDQYVGLFVLNTEAGETTLLPGEAGNSCICGAAVDDDVFVRLRLRISVESTGFDLHIYDLPDGRENVLPAPPQLEAFNTSGDVLISPDGTQAIYTLATVSDFGTPDQSVESIFILVDLARLTQTVITPSPVSTFVRPVAWTEDNSAVLFTSPEEDGTWKISLDDGRLQRIADAAYLGVLGAASSDP